VFKTAGDSENEWVSAEFGDMAALAGVASFSAGTDASKPPHSATVIASGLEVYVPLEGLVDFEAEAARLTKERVKIAGELEKVQRKLSNEGFLAKAAPEVIDKDRAKAAELADSLALVEGQLAELS
jgi:valyl-tRNA synthetase